MSTYIMLFNYTDQGLRNVKKSPGRLDAARKAAAERRAASRLPPMA